MRLRGRFFGNRGMVTGFITLIFTYVASTVLTIFTHINIYTGFTILFGGAVLFRLFSFYFLTRQYEPSQTGDEENSPSLIKMITSLGASNLGKFNLFMALINFCVSISGPFFAVYMLRDLHYNYTQYNLVSSAAALATLVFYNYWGRRADAAGNIKVVRITSIILPIVPVLWLGSTNVIYLMFANVVSGFAWSGYSLAAQNFVYDASEPALRPKLLALNNALSGIAGGFGFLLGGAVVSHLPVLFGNQLHSVFVLSGCLRALVVIVLIKHITEVRNVSGTSTWNLLKLKMDNNALKKVGNRVKEVLRIPVDEP